MNNRHSCMIMSSMSMKAWTLQLLCDNLQVYRSDMKLYGKEMGGICVQALCENQSEEGL